MWQANDVYYLLIIDACRETPEEPAVGFSGTLDPVYRDASDAKSEKAMRWALCAGTSRGSLAADAGTLDASHLGAFTSCVISEECGLFQPNVPVTKAIKLASDRVRNNQSRCKAPFTLLDNIFDFCLYDDVPAEQTQIAQIFSSIAPRSFLKEKRQTKVGAQRSWVPLSKSRAMSFSSGLTL